MKNKCKTWRSGFVSMIVEEFGVAPKSLETILDELGIWRRGCPDMALLTFEETCSHSVSHNNYQISDVNIRILEIVPLS